MEQLNQSDPSATEALDLLKKQIKTTRTFLLIVAFITVISAIISLFSLVIQNGGLADLIVILLLAIVYFGLAWWTKTRPYTALRVGLVITIVVIAAGAIIHPASIVDHWPSRLLTILVLCMGFPDARDAEKKLKKQTT